MSNVKVFYHGQDLDGWASGAVVKYRFPEAGMFPINYGDKFPWEEIEGGETVYMVDFSLQPFSDMVLLAKFLDDNGGELIWIDHHKGVVEDFKKSGIPCDGIIDTSCAACELTWEYLFNSKVPKFIRLLSLYDVWSHNDEEFNWDFIEGFQYGFKAWSKDPKEDMQFWEDWFTTSNMSARDQYSLVSSTEADGKLIKSYIEDRFRSEISSRSYKIDWEGYRCLVVNSDPYIANFMSRSKEFEDCDIAISYANKKGEMWVVSLRTLRSDIDLSELAKKYGGGGHQKAAGFSWKSPGLPWEVEIK
jgi:oligoribonuclease NrnB/cAMP/cGMP phosphodiesterase (DHH superfamily)